MKGNCYLFVKRNLNFKKKHGKVFQILLYLYTKITYFYFLTITFSNFARKIQNLFNIFNFYYV